EGTTEINDIEGIKFAGNTIAYKLKEEASGENEEGNLDSVHSVEEFNRQDMEELLAKRKAEAEELARRQKEKIEMLEKAEKDGKLTF
ncbi:MAG: hypothetical protein UX75_C0035G0001, partial [Candidatus Moranbacteria bacterium GW2011_GWE2_47_10]